MPLKLYDTLSRSIQPLEAATPPSFRFYCCGPTVYGPAHIGNFRTFLLQDVLRRTLEISGLNPCHVRNITDVDDKTIRRSQEEGRALGDVTREWTDKFHADCKALNLLRPHEEPRATKHIREQIKMIESLLDKGLAYVAQDGSIYYKIEAFPEYGSLSRVKERELRIGTTRRGTAMTADEYDRDAVSDFALWKAWKPDDGPVKWPGPKGAAKGRPGWHIECSAMSRKYLGDTIDLHAGGVDLLFPHHENEIAQSEGCTGQTFVNHWWHTEHLLVDGRKMSKSLGNLYTLDDLTARGFSPMAVRYALLAGHPRKQLNFTLDSLHAAESALKKLRALADKLTSDANKPSDDLYNTKDILRRGDEAFGTNEGLNKLRDDLNTPAALGELFMERKLGLGENSALAEPDFYTFRRIIYALGLDLRVSSSPDVPASISALAKERWAARQRKDWATADELRTRLQEQGWKVTDSKDGYELAPLP